MAVFPSVRKNMLFASLAYAFFALTQWGIVVVLSRIGTPEDVGTLTVLTALITPIFLLANMDMRNGHSADDLTDFSPSDYFALRLWSSFLAVTINSSDCLYLFFFIWFFLFKYQLLHMRLLSFLARKLT